MSNDPAPAPREHEYSFDLKLFSSITIRAVNLAEAKQRFEAMINALTIVFGDELTRDLSRYLVREPSVDISDGHELMEVDGHDVYDMEDEDVDAYVEVEAVKSVILP